MARSDLAQVIEEYRGTIDAIVTGDPEPQKRLWSQRDDATLANPVGPLVVGWEQVKEHLDRSASTVRDGEPLKFESIAEYSSGNLGYNVQLERTRARFGGAEEMTPVSLRVTTIFRREDGVWRILHRHADSTAPRAIQSDPEPR